MSKSNICKRVFWMYPRLFIGLGGCGLLAFWLAVPPMDDMLIMLGNGPPLPELEHLLFALLSELLRTVVGLIGIAAIIAVFVAPSRSTTDSFRNPTWRD